MVEKIDKKIAYAFFLYVLGVILRYWAMSIGSGFDFESFCIVGELVSHFKNVYAETTRYNYGPIFFLIQGVSYITAHLLSRDIQQTYRVILVGLFTLTDFAIAMWLARRYNLKTSLIFFLNPISIVITGYHNQFDNMAILLALISCRYYNEDENFTKKDWLFVLFMALSLTMKHILFLFPFWLFVKQGLPFKKKIVYVFLPPFLFGLSFIPFVLGNIDAFYGVARNVFLYRSNPISPLLGELLGIPLQFYFSLYILIMVLAAFVFRKQSYDYILMLYLISMFTFSSSMAPQYYVIPLITLCVLDKGIIRNIYFFFVGGLLMLGEFESPIFNEWLIGEMLISHIANIAVWVTFIFVLIQIIKIYATRKR